jgi:hypothetical protein
MKVERKQYRGLVKKAWELQALAEEHAKLYAVECPIASVRIMRPSGAIFVVLANGQEVLVPQPE